MADPFVGEIRMTGFNFAPVGWALCNGQLLSIAQNSALFALLGTQFGGNGQTTFGLPDLQGRVPMHQGSGSGLTPRTMGEKAGTESVQLTAAQMPAHSHVTSVPATAAVATAASPAGSVPAKAADGENNYAATSDGSSIACSAASAGSSQAHPNIQPYQVVNFIIATQGIFPSRS